MSKHLALLAALVAVTACAAKPTARVAPAPSGAPATILARGERLLAARERLAAGDVSLRPALNAVLDSARRAMAARPVSVTQKTRVPPSGSKHDYMSLGPYWWPDSTKPGGLPFIRRDGIVNPESRLDHDGWRMQGMIFRVEALSLAHWFTGDEQYARAAGTHLRVWFLDSATRMNPNLEYGQAIPGVTAGRGVGIIDTRNLPYLVDAVRLLDGTAALTPAERLAFSAWCSAYLKWLLESKNGIEERDATNNHGVFYDEQVAALALFVGDTAEARRTLLRARGRLDAQVERDGRQPLELERTRPLHYSLFNLDAFTMLAEMGRHVGVEMWRYTTPKGGSLGAAVRFVAPYADRTLKWPTPQVSEATNDVFVPPLRRAAMVLGDPVIAAALQRLPSPYLTTDFSILQHAGLRSATDTVIEAALLRAGAQLERTANALYPANGFPRLTRADGNWEQRPFNQWTSGFFAGTLWQMYRATGDARWRPLAERWTAGLEPAKRITTTHDLGFLLYDSFGLGLELTGNPQYRAVLLEGARSLATRYNPVVGAIKSWETAGMTDRRGAWKYPVIVDNLMNLELLFWAGGAPGGDSALARMAESHALASARVHLRADGSATHVALFDPATGALEGTTTWQGFDDASAWARGQAWAIHGFAASYGRTRRPELLTAAVRAADFFVASLPADAVPYWDFRLPAGAPRERDASAAAIASSGLYELAAYVSAAEAVRYRAAADRMLLALASPAFMAPASPSGAVLMHSTGQRPQGGEIDVGLSYADYYFVEAMGRRRAGR